MLAYGRGGVWAYGRIGVWACGRGVDLVDLVDGVDEVWQGASGAAPEIGGWRLPGAFTALFLNIGACRLDRMGKR